MRFQAHNHHGFGSVPLPLGTRGFPISNFNPYKSSSVLIQIYVHKSDLKFDILASLKGLDFTTDILNLA